MEFRWFQRLPHDGAATIHWKDSKLCKRKPVGSEQKGTKFVLIFELADGKWHLSTESALAAREQTQLSMSCFIFCSTLNNPLWNTRFDFFFLHERNGINGKEEWKTFNQCEIKLQKHCVRARRQRGNTSQIKIDNDHTRTTVRPGYCRRGRTIPGRCFCCTEQTDEIKLAVKTHEHCYSIHSHIGHTNKRFNLLI